MIAYPTLFSPSATWRSSWYTESPYLFKTHWLHVWRMHLKISGQPARILLRALYVSFPPPFLMQCQILLYPAISFEFFSTTSISDPFKPTWSHTSVTNIRIKFQEEIEPREPLEDEIGKLIHFSAPKPISKVVTPCHLLLLSVLHIHTLTLLPPRKRKKEQ